MTFEEKDNTIRCLFSGEMNTEVCSMLESELNFRIDGFLKNHDSGNVIFDLSEVQYISSAFLRLCLLYCKHAGNRNFAIRNVSPDVHKIFQIAGFTEMMNVE